MSKPSQKLIFCALFYSVSVFFSPSLSNAQSTVELLEKILKEKTENHLNAANRQHELDLLGANLRARNEAFLTNIAFQRYSNKLSQLEQVNENLNKFGMDVIDKTANKLNELYENSTTQKEYLSKSISFLDDEIRRLNRVVVYLNRGRQHTGLIEDQYELEYYENYHSLTEGDSLLGYSRDFVNDHINISNDIPEDMIQHYIFGIISTLSSESNYNKVKQRKSSRSILVLQRERNELMEQLLEVMEEEINLRESSLKENDPDAYKKREGLLKLRRLVIENDISKIDTQISLLEIERNN